MNANMSTPDEHLTCTLSKRPCVPWSWATLDAVKAESQRRVQRYKALLSALLSEEEELVRRVEEAMRRKSACLKSELEALARFPYVATPNDRLGSGGTPSSRG